MPLQFKAVPLHSMNRPAQQESLDPGVPCDADATLVKVF